ncbi:hypothetical protein [Halothiobacillus sp. DCM-1]|uniref:hypothetical protein n=1 Tax=Halothiobacillus sp. DCM-1 TaxID=3112558 RepID=UPI00324E4E63
MSDLFFERKANFILGLLDSRRSVLWVMISVPIFFGLLSVFYGQPSGWDFYNYHVYNGYALAHGRLSLDFAPAGFQSYFNPVLDYFYYVMSENLPPRVVGFLMGLAPALVFIPLWLTIRLVVFRSGLWRSRLYSIITILALMGVFSVSFISRAGSVDGDSITAIFQILALYFILKNVVGFGEDSVNPTLWAIVAGVVSGLGTGLKLTGTPASLALCIGLLFIGRQGWGRLRFPFLFGVGVILGISMTGGFWFFQMYQHFGNPLFPQLGYFFSNNLSSPVGVIDKRFIPTGFVDFLIRPFDFLFNPGRLDGAAWPQVTWPILYIVFIVFLIKKMKGVDSSTRKLGVSSIFVLLYTLFGFVFWLLLFGIYRYQIYFYLTAPLALLIFIRQLVDELDSVRYLVVIALFSIFFALVLGAKSYEGEPWSDKYIQASPSDAFTVPVGSVVLFVGQPIGWIAPFFPQAVSLIGIDNNFPKSDGYVERVRQLVAKNNLTYAVFELPVNNRLSVVVRANAILNTLKINRSMMGCDFIQWLLKHSHMHASFRQLDGSSDGMQCELSVPEEDKKEFEQETSDAWKRARSALAAYGYDLSGAQCDIKQAYVGRRPFTFELCQLN